MQAEANPIQQVPEEQVREMADAFYSAEELADRATEQLSELQFVKLLLKSLTYGVLLYTAVAGTYWIGSLAWTGIPNLVRLLTG
ncbi:MAG: hypothetical protein P9L99_14505 [Candidatus Lernaella stagnicola]|nr:hypothetical protein [Candidatus Lernaella stagnicola]